MDIYFVIPILRLCIGKGNQGQEYKLRKWLGVALLSSAKLSWSQTTKVKLISSCSKLWLLGFKSQLIGFSHGFDTMILHVTKGNTMTLHTMFTIRSMLHTTLIVLQILSRSTGLLWVLLRNRFHVSSRSMAKYNMRCTIIRYKQNYGSAKISLDDISFTRCTTLDKLTVSFLWPGINNLVEQTLASWRRVKLQLSTTIKIANQILDWWKKVLHST